MLIISQTVAVRQKVNRSQLGIDYGYGSIFICLSYDKRHRIVLEANTLLDTVREKAAIEHSLSSV